MSYEERWVVLSMKQHLTFYFFLLAGNEMMKQEKYKEAIDFYSSAIEKDGNNAVYYCNRYTYSTWLNTVKSTGRNVCSTDNVRKWSTWSDSALWWVGCDKDITVLV